MAARKEQEQRQNEMKQTSFLVDMTTNGQDKITVEVDVYQSYISLNEKIILLATNDDHKVLGNLVVKSLSNSPGNKDGCKAFFKLASSNHHSKFRWSDTLIYFKHAFELWSTKNVKVSADQYFITASESTPVLPVISSSDIPTPSSSASASSSIPKPDVSSPEWPKWALARLGDLLSLISVSDCDILNGLHSQRVAICQARRTITSLSYMRSSHLAEIEKIDALIRKATLAADLHSQSPVPEPIPKTISQLESQKILKQEFIAILDVSYKRICQQLVVATEEARDIYKCLSEDPSGKRTAFIQERDELVKLWNSGHGYHCEVCNSIIPLNLIGGYDSNDVCRVCSMPLPPNMRLPSYTPTLSPGFLSTELSDVAASPSTFKPSLKKETYSPIDGFGLITCLSEDLLRELE